ncbi:unnamed protein product [Sphacelaria rigidula]
MSVREVPREGSHAAVGPSRRTTDSYAQTSSRRGGVGSVKASPPFLGDRLRTWSGESAACSVPALSGCEVNGLMTTACKVMSTPLSPPSPPSLKKRHIVPDLAFSRHTRAHACAAPLVHLCYYSRLGMSNGRARGGGVGCTSSLEKCFSSLHLVADVGIFDRRKSWHVRAESVGQFLCMDHPWLKPFTRARRSPSFVRER